MLASGTVPGIDAHGSKTIEAKLQIPHDIITTNVPYCKVIEVSYMLNVVIHRHKMRFPITISLVPLSHDVPVQNPRLTPSPHLHINPVPTAPNEQNLPPRRESRKLIYRITLLQNLLFFFFLF